MADSLQATLRAASAALHAAAVALQAAELAAAEAQASAAARPALQPPGPDDGVLLSAREAALFAGVGLTTARSWLAADGPLSAWTVALPSSGRGSRSRRRIARRHLAAWLQQQPGGKP